MRSRRLDRNVELERDELVSALSPIKSVSWRTSQRANLFSYALEAILVIEAEADDEYVCSRVRDWAHRIVRI